MKVLYDYFIQQIKIEQRNKYNLKHSEYLKRIGKIPQQQEKNQQQGSYKQPKKRQRFINKTEKNLYQNREQVPIKPKLQKNNFQKSGVNQMLQINNQFKNIDLPSQNNNIIQQTVKFQRQILGPKKQQILQQFPPENQVIQLFQCLQGCGRKFKSQLLEKHMKVCKKIFQQKRKPFQVKTIDEQAQKAKLKAEKQPNKQQLNKKSKWKKESQALRNMMKKNKGQQVQQEDDRIQCGGCGRKFSSSAAQRHIEKCLNKNKFK